MRLNSRRFPRLPAHRRDELRLLAARSNQVVLFAAATGALTGLFVAGFEHVVVDVMFERVVGLSLPLVMVLPALGLLGSLGVRRFIGRGVSPATADEYLHGFHDAGHRLTVRDAATRAMAAVLTLGSGVPMGLEGPSMYSGASIGAALQRRAPRVFRNADHRVLLVAGAAAGVAAIFKAPATGAVFALEVPYQDDLARRMLLPALVASVSSYAVFAAILGTSPLFPIGGVTSFELRDLAGAVLVGIIAGAGARVFARMLMSAKAAAMRPHPIRTTLAAGAVLALLIWVGQLVVGTSLIVGSGYRAVAWAAEGEHALPLLLAVLVLRCFATAAAVAGGGVGGIFVPLVVGGALTGTMVARVVDQADLSLFLVIGVAAFLGAGYRVPLAAVMFVAETTGRASFVVPGVIAAVTAELMMGRSSVTRYQRTTDVMLHRHAEVFARPSERDSNDEASPPDA